MDWSPIAANAILIFLGVISSLLLGLGTLAIKALAKKYNLQNEELIQNQFEIAMERGIHAAEEWANKSATQPSGNEKLDYALQLVRSIALQPQIKQLTDEQLKKLIEAKLFASINKDKV